MKKLLSIIISIVMLASVTIPFSAYSADSGFYDNWYSKAKNAEFNKKYTEICDSTDNYFSYTLSTQKRCDVFEISLPVKSTLNIKTESKSTDSFTGCDDYGNDKYYVFDVNDLNSEPFVINIGFYDYEINNGYCIRNNTIILDAGEYYIVKEYFDDIDGYSEPYDITFSFSCLNHSYDKTGKVTKAATYTATGVKTYTCSICGQNKNETIAKLPKVSNTASIKAKTATVKYSKLRKKNQTVARKNAIVVSKAKGTVTYKKVSGNKKITINKKTGKITLKKGLKKGTYKLKVKVTASGTSKYKKTVKTVTVKIKVK